MSSICLKYYGKKTIFLNKICVKFKSLFADSLNTNKELFWKTFEKYKTLYNLKAKFHIAWNFLKRENQFTLFFFYKPHPFIKLLWSPLYLEKLSTKPRLIEEKGETKKLRPKAILRLFTLKIWKRLHKTSHITALTNGSDKCFCSNDLRNFKNSTLKPEFFSHPNKKSTKWKSKLKGLHNLNVPQKLQFIEHLKLKKNKWNSVSYTC